ncbi:YolD-like family protein [Sporosarcina sp. USHLN248]|uniref:YolD-like family protein n=1 Tax=Sporosarcina sp. USHLN248 TaxID=3081300 RepID=UPI00301A4BAA
MSKVQNDIKDRGRIKWTAMMLPEHIQALRKMNEENDYVERPELTEWELQGLQGELERAFVQKIDTIVTTWKDGKTSPYIGKITKLDPIHGLISIDGPYGSDHIPVGNIVKVHSM